MQTVHRQAQAHTRAGTQATQMYTHRPTDRQAGEDRPSRLKGSNLKVIYIESVVLTRILI